MAGIQLSGLASGLDWKTLVDQLMAAEKVPVTTLQTTKATNTNKATVLDNLKSALTDLQTSVKALSTDAGDPYSDRTASVSGGSTWTASAANGTSTGTYLLNVSQLATASTRTGATGAAGKLSATSDVSGVSMATVPVGTGVTAGDFTVNGAKVTVALTDSLQDVFDKISTATGGTVTAAYDPNTDKVSLTGQSEIVLGASNDSSNFLSAFSLANNGTAQVIAPKALGTVSLSTAIAHANLSNAITGVDASGNGSFSVNGVAINYNVNSDSITAVLGRINSSTAGVNASYDKLNGRFVMTNKTTGDVGLSVSESAGGLLGAMGLSSSTLSRGQNAQFSIDGGPTLTSPTNTLDSSVTGVTGLTVNATSLDSQSVTVGGSTSGLRSKIEDFISKYNSVQSYIDKVTATTTGTDGKVTPSLMTSDLEVADVAKQLRSKVFGDVSGLSGTIQRLESIGVSFASKASTLSVTDSTKLDNALLNNSSDVRSLFTSTNGLVSRLDSYLTTVTGSSGVLATQTNSLTKQNSSIDNQIDAMNRRLDQEQALLESSFEHMETMQSTINSQLTTLENAFGTSSSSSSTKKTS